MNVRLAVTSAIAKIKTIAKSAAIAKQTAMTIAVISVRGRAIAGTCGTCVRVAVVNEQRRCDCLLGYEFCYETCPRQQARDDQADGTK